jgi:hypothetical protein
MSEDHHDDHHEEHDHCGTEDHTVSVSGRRQFLRRSLGSLIGLSIASPMLGLVTGTPQLSGLSSLWAADPLVEQMANSAGIRSIVLLWMDGGPAQTDTFDPKPGSKNGGAFKAINTALPGVQFSEHLPRVASIADRLAVIRSMTTGEGNHQRAKHYMRTGYKPAGTVKFPGMGAMAAHEMPKSPLEIPMNVSINAPATPQGFSACATIHFTSPIRRSRCRISRCLRVSPRSDLAAACSCSAKMNHVSRGHSARPVATLRVIRKSPTARTRL